MLVDIMDSSLIPTCNIVQEINRKANETLIQAFQEAKLYEEQITVEFGLHSPNLTLT